MFSDLLQYYDSISQIRDFATGVQKSIFEFPQLYAGIATSGDTNGDSPNPDFLLGNAKDFGPQMRIAKGVQRLIISSESHSRNTKVDPYVRDSAVVGLLGLFLVCTTQIAFP